VVPLGLSRISALSGRSRAAKCWILNERSVPRGSSRLGHKLLMTSAASQAKDENVAAGQASIFEKGPNKVRSSARLDGPVRCQFAGLIPTFSDYAREGSGPARSYACADGLPILARRERRVAWTGASQVWRPK
jgi:hypothetical protein